MDQNNREHQNAWHYVVTKGKQVKVVIMYRNAASQYYFSVERKHFNIPLPANSTIKGKVDHTV